MFNQVMKNSALCAKIRAMTGKMLSDMDYDALMNMTSVSAVASYLTENTAYAEAFVGLPVAKMHRAALERRLREHLRSDFQRIIPFMDSGAKKFMDVFILNEGISKIKLCLRLININHTDQAREYMSKIYLGKTELPVETIMGIGTMDDFIELLRGTPYYTPLSFFSGKPEVQKLFRMEMALDTYWANMVYKYAQKYLSRTESKSVMHVYGTEFDLENLTFLLRCKRTFDMTDDEIYTSIIPRYYRLKEETISKIVKSETWEEAISIITEETPYGKAFSKDDRFIEKRQGEYITAIKRRTNNVDRYSVQSPVCFMHLRQVEIDNIVSIIEGIRYGLDPDKTATYLIGYGRKGAKT